MTTTSRPPGTPTRPAPQPTRVEFVEALQELRTWSGLTLKMLEARHDTLKVSTSSDYQRGVRWPRWEWVHAFVTTCLTHQRLTDPVRIQAELVHWRAAWTHAHRTHHDPPPQPAGVHAATGDQREDVQGPTGLCTLHADLAPPHDEQPTTVTTISGNSDSTAANTGAKNTENTPGHTLTTTPMVEQDHHTAATPLRHPRWWMLGALAAVVIVTGAVLVTTTDVVETPDTTGSTNSAERPPPLVPGKTYTETVNTPQGARTYSKPHNLSGEWQRIPNRTNVEVSCHITAPTVPSVGTYWYRIATPPWNNQYYSPANSFLNGDPPDGTAPTHAVDQTVPQCPH
jgi:hypothetical protein